MSNIFAVNQTAEWYTFSDFEIFQDSEGFDRIRPKPGSKQISYNPFEYGEIERSFDESDTNMLLSFAAIGQATENARKTKSKVLKFVQEYGLLGFYKYWMLYMYVDTEKVITKPSRINPRLPLNMSYSDYRSLFFDKDYSIREINVWPIMSWPWYHYSERIDWIIEKARETWKHLQAVNELNEAIRSGEYLFSDNTSTGKKEHKYYINFMDVQLPAIQFGASNISLGLEYNSEKQELEISWDTGSLMGFIDIIHIKKCTNKKTIGECKECGMPFLISSPLKNSGCCTGICRHRFNARKSKAFSDLEKKKSTLTNEEYSQKFLEVVQRYGNINTKN